MIGFKGYSYSVSVCLPRQPQANVTIAVERMFPGDLDRLARMSLIEGE